MQQYIVKYRLPHMRADELPLTFACQADDAAHAREQAANAESAATIVRVRGTKLQPYTVIVGLQFDDIGRGYSAHVLARDPDHAADRAERAARSDNCEPSGCIIWTAEGWINDLTAPA